MMRYTGNMMSHGMLNALFVVWAVAVALLVVFAAFHGEEGDDTLENWDNGKALP